MNLFQGIFWQIYLLLTMLVRIWPLIPNCLSLVRIMLDMILRVVLLKSEGISYYKIFSPFIFICWVLTEICGKLSVWHVFCYIYLYIFFWKTEDWCNLKDQFNNAFGYGINLTLCHETCYSEIGWSENIKLSVYVTAWKCFHMLDSWILSCRYKMRERKRETL